MVCEAELASEYHVSQRAILASKVGQTDLVFSMQSGFISRSVRANMTGDMVTLLAWRRTCDLQVAGSSPD